MQTECIISINLVDVTAKSDSSPTITNNAGFASVDYLKDDNHIVDDFMSLEWNYSILDGTMQHLPDEMALAEYPVFSDEMTGEDCARTNDPMLTISFTKEHSSAGISFGFIRDSPAQIIIKWYDSGGGRITEETFCPNSVNYFCEKKVENYRGLQIFFIGSRTPYRYLKITNIEYGCELNYGGENVISAQILEELDPTSAELSINTFDFSIFDTDREFNILNQKGKYSLLQSLQEIRAREVVDGSTINMGTFYLEKKESKSESEIAFSAVDALGVIDKTNFVRGRIYEDEAVETIINEIMDSAGWSKYEISEELKNVRLSGYIPVCTHREALQQVVFALRAVADCSRTNLIRIYRQNKAADIKLKYDRIFVSGEMVEELEYVSGIAITAHKFELSSSTSTVFDGALNKGISEVTFSKPVTNLNITGGQILESGINYALVKMTVDGECKITGNEYEDIQSTFIRNLDVIDHGEAPNTISVKNATLVGRNNVYLLAEHLFDYYALRRATDVRFVLETEYTGRWICVKSHLNMFINGGIESQKIDLANGFISQAHIVGYNTLETDFIFTGKEIHTGERIGVI